MSFTGSLSIGIHNMPASSPGATIRTHMRYGFLRLCSNRHGLRRAALLSTLDGAVSNPPCTGECLTARCAGGLGGWATTAARNLHRAAQIVRDEHGGELPRDLKSLRKLPGIGRYTTGAIASIAFDMDEPALDGNIRRVLARIFDVAEPARSPGGERRLWELAAANLPPGRAGNTTRQRQWIWAPRSARRAVPTAQAARLQPGAGRALGIQEQRPVLDASQRRRTTL